MKKKPSKWIQVRVTETDKKLYSRLLKATKHRTDPSISSLVWLGLAKVLDEREARK